MKWQPIETAPKDGQSILVWWEYWSSFPIVAFYEDDEWIAERALNSRTTPTHWMPLPSPPEAVTE